MRVDVHDGDSTVSSEPYIPGPKVILYDCEGTPLKRPIGFTRPIDNRPGDRVISRFPKGK